MPVTLDRRVKITLTYTPPHVGWYFSIVLLGRVKTIACIHALLVRTKYNGLRLIECKVVSNITTLRHENSPWSPSQTWRRPLSLSANSVPFPSRRPRSGALHLREHATITS